MKITVVILMLSLCVLAWGAPLPDAPKTVEHDPCVIPTSTR